VRSVAPSLARWLRREAVAAGVVSFTILASIAAQHFATLDRSRLGSGEAPTELALAPGSRHLWAASWDRRSLRMLDAATGAEQGSLGMIRRPFDVAALASPDAAAFFGRFGGDLCLALASPERKLEDVCSPVAERIPDPNGGTTRLVPNLLAIASAPPSSFLAAVAWSGGSGGTASEWGVLRLTPRSEHLEVDASSPRRPFAGVRRAKGLIVADAATRRVWVTPSSAPLLYALDPGLAPEREVELPERPSALALDGARGRGFVALEGRDELRVLDAETLALRAVAKTGHGPVALLLSPDARELWVLLRGDRALVAVDPATLAERRRIELAGRPWSFACDWAHGRMWVSEPELGQVASLAIGTVP